MLKFKSTFIVSPFSTNTQPVQSSLFNRSFSKTLICEHTTKCFQSGQIITWGSVCDCVWKASIHFCWQSTAKHHLKNKLRKKQKRCQASFGGGCDYSPPTQLSNSLSVSLSVVNPPKRKMRSDDTGVKECQDRPTGHCWGVLLQDGQSQAGILNIKYGKEQWEKGSMFIVEDSLVPLQTCLSQIIILISFSEFINIRTNSLKTSPFILW